MFRLAKEKELTDNRLNKFLAEHRNLTQGRYKKLEEAYRTDYPIMHLPPKLAYKPDNRIAVNFAKYIVDTMNGYFIGHPIKITAEEGNIGITYVSPMEAFMIYDDSVLERPRAFVRLYIDEDEVLHGSISDETTVRHFVQNGKLVWEDEKIHGFDGVPATEYRENEEAMGIFEPVLTMINAYNKAISEKANDVDYFADAYLKILGTQLDAEELKNIRSDRIINFDGDTNGVSVDFLSKPNGDTTQENLIDRLERLIFQISMVANISDENFGTSSGIAMKYKLQAMSNLAKTKERKFVSGMNRMYLQTFWTRHRLRHSFPELYLRKHSFLFCPSWTM